MAKSADNYSNLRKLGGGGNVCLSQQAEKDYFWFAYIFNRKELKKILTGALKHNLNDQPLSPPSD